jgi:hypothetical protein
MKAFSTYFSIVDKCSTFVQALPPRRIQHYPAMPTGTPNRDFHTFPNFTGNLLDAVMGRAPSGQEVWPSSER